MIMNNNYNLKVCLLHHLEATNQTIKGRLAALTFPCIAEFFNQVPHIVIQSYVHIVIQSYGHIVIWSYSHIVIQSYSHIVIWSYSHIVIQSYSYIVIQSFSQLSLFHASPSSSIRSPILSSSSWRFQSMPSYLYTSIIVVTVIIIVIVTFPCFAKFFNQVLHCHRRHFI